MTVRLSAAIMAHPRRAEMVEGLKARLDRPVPVVWDHRNDRHDTGIRAIEAFDPDATHHLVIQDDVLPCRDLLAGVQRALAVVPEGHPASLYLGRPRPFHNAVRRAVRSAGPDVSWVTMAGIYWGPAVVIPTEAIEGLSRWWWGQGRIHTNYDRRLSRWFERHGAPECWYSWPSLVDHIGDESLSHDTTGRRHAHRFVGADASALDVDVTGEVVHMQDTGRLDRTRERLAPA